MALLLAHLYSGKKVIPQPKNIFFNKADEVKKEKVLQIITNELHQKALDIYEADKGKINCQRVKDLYFPSIARYPE